MKFNEFLIILYVDSINHYVMIKNKQKIVYYNNYFQSPKNKSLCHNEEKNKYIKKSTNNQRFNNDNQRKIIIISTKTLYKQTSEYIG